MSGLKATLLQTIEEIKKNPNSAQVVFRANTQLLDGVRCSAKVREFDEIYVDEPPSLGGNDSSMNPVELILAALGTCQEIMYAAYASVMDIKLDAVKVDVKGKLDLQGLFGMNDKIAAGYSGISYITRLSSEESAEKIAALVQAVEAHCPVQDTLMRPIPVKGEVLLNDKALAETAEA